MALQRVEDLDMWEDEIESIEKMISEHDVLNFLLYIKERIFKKNLSFKVDKDNNIIIFLKNKVLKIYF